MIQVCKTLLISVLLQSNENYVMSFDVLQDMLDDQVILVGVSIVDYMSMILEYLSLHGI